MEPGQYADERSKFNIVNLGLRVLGNGAVFVQYAQDGKAKDAGLVGWKEFLSWLTKHVKD